MAENENAEAYRDGYAAALSKPEIDGVRATALRDAAVALYEGYGPDFLEDADSIYGEWLERRAAALAAPVPHPAATDPSDGGGGRG